MKKLAILSLMLMQSAIPFAHAGAQAVSDDGSPVKYTDYIIAKLNKGIDENQINAALVIGGTIAYETKKYIEGSTSDIPSMLIFPTRAELEAFLKKYNQDQIKELFGFSDNFKAFSEADLKLFLEKPLHVLDLNGSIQGLRVSVKLTDRETILGTQLNDSFQSLSKIPNPRIFNSKSLKGDMVQLFLLNSQLDSTDKPSYIVLDKYFYPFDDTLALGRITNYLMTAKPINDKAQMFNKIQEDIRKVFVSQVVAKGCLNNNTQLSQYLFHSDIYSKKYHKAIDNALGDIADDLDKDIEPCNREPSANGYLIDINLDNYSVSKTFDYQKVSDQETVGEMPKDFHPLIIKSLSEFAKDADKLTLLPYFDGKNMLVSESGVGKVASIDKDQRLTEVYPFYTITSDDKQAILKYEKTLDNLNRLYGNILQPNYIDPEKRFMVGKNYEGKWLSDVMYKPFGKKAHSILLQAMKRADNTLHAYMSTLPIDDFSIKNQPSQTFFFGQLSGDTLKSYESQSVTLPDGNTLPFEVFKNLKIIINGKEYSSIAEIMEQAAKVLDPEYLEERVKTYGLVNNPASKMLRIKKNQYASTDYRYSGVVHPSQDVAVKIYHDVYYDVANPKLQEKPAEVSVTLDNENNALKINHNYHLPQERKILLDLQIYGILKPYLVMAAKDYKKDIRDWEKILQSSIFTTGFLANNILSKDANWLALAVLVELSSPNAMGKPRLPGSIDFVCCKK